MVKRSKAYFRSVWISDVHLGTRACRVDALLEFLSSIETEHLYLVGDIIDVWALKRRWFWPQSHNDVVRKILKRASNGAHVVYIPGNHDEDFRDHCGLVFGGVDVRMETVHETADGRRMLLLHGDKFDTVIQNMPVITALGDWAYDWILTANAGLNWARRKMGLRYWSLAAYLKQKVKMICEFASDYEKTLARYAREQGCDAVLSGHIHRPAMKDVDGVLYLNDGDWVENCTAVVEHFDGRLELLHVERDGAPVTQELIPEMAT
jgi:UDP-2,3-diacylglucosamine pyrophosphatase LpxH